MAEKVPPFEWCPFEDMTDKKILKIARKYYKEIDNPETMHRYDLIKRLDCIDSRPCQLRVVELNWFAGFFLGLWIRIRDFFDKRRNPEYWT